ncbi:ATP-dependent DNA ligase [Heliocybe sulcata]|uniref:DNA ligase n=1 Tax=Heliocybe sulcata TaxID=5364 RepID=A0A5C3NCG7_9AGAM|nr:ATP-dependent DNA ligase [Heliocybe sulcata]
MPTYPEMALDPTIFEVDPTIWCPNKPIPYSFLAHALSTLTTTRSRIAILNILTNTLRVILKTHPPSLLPSLYILSNTLSPPYESIELGLGYSTVTKAIQHVSGLSSAALKRLYTKTGDPGDVAFEAKSNVRTLIPHPPLLITSVYDSMLKIALAKGQGTAKQKQSIVEKLLVAAKGEEVRFLVRTLFQNLRVGAVRTSILTALARAMVMTLPSSISDTSAINLSHYADEALITAVKELNLTKSGGKKKKVEDAVDPSNILSEKFAAAEALIKRVYVQHPNYGHIARALVEMGLNDLAEHVPLTVGIPLHPTLGSPTRSLDEVYDRLENLAFSAEFKYDGQRAQIHGWKDSSEGPVSVKIFSRHLEDMTDKYPDVVQLVQNSFTADPELQSFIIDTEIVAIDPRNGELRTFQELSNRARKDVQMTEIKIAVCVFAFDLLYLDGQILLQEPFRKRRALLRTRLPPVIPEWKGAARLDHVRSVESEAGREAIEEFWQEAVESRVEGLMVKLLDSGEVLEEPSNKKGRPRRKPLPATYEPDKRTSAWLKLKKDYVTGLGDSLDLVPIGGWHGNGRKVQWWSPVLLALYDPSSGKLVAVCKCMSGFSDVFYKSMKEKYAEGSENCSYQNIWDVETGGLKPHVYFKPQEVWEIRGADVTISPVSVAALGLVSQSRGLSLRFPRFMKVREDKNIEQASIPDFLAGMYRGQQGKREKVEGVDDGDLLDATMESEAQESEADLSNSD